VRLVRAAMNMLNVSLTARLTVQVKTVGVMAAAEPVETARMATPAL
jgi:hypothetical protein